MEKYSGREEHTLPSLEEQGNPQDRMRFIITPTAELERSALSTDAEFMDAVGGVHGVVVLVH